MGENRQKLGDPDAFAASGGPEWYKEFSAHMEEDRIRYVEALDLVGEMLDADLAAKAGYSSAEAYLADIQRLSLRHARQLVSHAKQVRLTLTPTGHQRPPALPAVREALSEGAVSADQVEEIVKAVGEIPDWAPIELRDLVEKTLVAEARAGGPGYVRATGKELIARIDQDGKQPRDEDPAEPANSFRYHRTSTGRMRFTGDIDREAAEELDAMLSALGKPQHVSDTIREQRLQPERHGDAFCAVVHAAATAGDDVPAEGGERPNINITLDYNKLMSGIGTATLELGDPIPACAVRRLACDANVIPMVLGADSVPLDLGRTVRVVPNKQRRALIVRDQGCAMPGCTARARWCEAHHIRSWLDGGPTDLTNLVLLCRRHHRLIEHSEWDVRITDDGLPEFRPPAYLDPTRTPLHNTLHRKRE